MIRIIPKCKKCEKLMRDSIILSDNDEDTFTQFIISYCPYCIKLDDKIEARCWARTECQEENKCEGDEK